MKRTGELLKKAREEKKLSLHEIGLSLKISTKVLKAIEEGDEKSLPAKTFLRGFVQSYANYLHLNTEEVLDLFYQEMGSTRHTPYIRPAESERPPSSEDVAAATPTRTPLRAEVKAEKPTPSEPPAEASEAPPEASVTPIRRRTQETSKSDGMQSLRDNKTSKTVGILIVSLVLVGLIIFTKKMIDKYTKEAELPQEVSQTIEGATPVVSETSEGSDAPTDEVAAPATEGNESTAAVTGASPLSTLATPAPSPAVSSQPTATPASTAGISTAKPLPTPSPSASPAASPSPSPTPVASASPTPTPTPSPSPTPEANKPVELIVEALDTVEIEYSAPNGKPQRIKLSAEQVHTFKSRSGLMINFSNGGAVNLIRNGKEIGIPGDLGKPIKMSF